MIGNLMTPDIFSSDKLVSTGMNAIIVTAGNSTQALFVTDSSYKNILLVLQYFVEH